MQEMPNRILVGTNIIILCPRLVSETFDVVIQIAYGVATAVSAESIIRASQATGTPNIRKQNLIRTSQINFYFTNDKKNISYLQGVRSKVGNTLRRFYCLNPS